MDDLRPHAASASREQLLYWLHEAAEIEHLLMCCYLYAAFSLKDSDPRWSSAQADAVARWRAAITGVAIDEMTHLALVGNLATALGGAPNFTRPVFPVDAGPYPAGFVIRLAPFSASTIEHFKFLERPQGEAFSDLGDAPDFAARRDYRRVIAADRLSPGARDYATVGELYALLDSALSATAAALGEPALFVGDPARQIDAALLSLPGLVAVTDLASARRAIHTIVEQGEGAGAERGDSHFARFGRIGDELAALRAADPAFEPAWPAASNPVMNPPIAASAERVHIDHPRQAAWLDLGNALYTSALRCLAQGFDSRDRSAKSVWLEASFGLMRAVSTVGGLLAARPARAGGGSPHAGLSFTPLRTLARLPEALAPALVAERLASLRERAQQLLAATEDGAAGAALEEVAAQEARLRGLVRHPDAGSARATAPTEPRPAGQVAAETAAATFATAAQEAAAAQDVEVVAGQALTIEFEGRRCIHSRHCVLEAPAVFRANTPGAWIHPDAADAEALVAVALHCPSGAIRFRRHDGGADESAPPVNTLRVRENGPYAIAAPLTIAGRADGFRATLCRCGRSNNKPWCDGSHTAAGFVASGEPPSGEAAALTALAQRGGSLAVTPLANGPLRVRGNLEICAGTGRVIARTTDARLCRCGQSRNKPFCDGSHRGAGFVADGE